MEEQEGKVNTTLEKLDDPLLGLLQVVHFPQEDLQCCFYLRRLGILVQRVNEVAHLHKVHCLATIPTAPSPANSTISYIL
ncbi:hypothetical protein GJAV_G00253230 [Gymnothorax javanicus]|nr:hypothetical protein GJAV_G00253230 [Gymnothorax javanicus]